MSSAVNLVQIAQKILSNWNLTLVRRYDSFASWVAEVELESGQRAFLKCSNPAAIRREAMALQAFNCNAVPSILARDYLNGSLLIDKIHEGETALEMYQRGEDDQATSCLATTIINLQSNQLPVDSAEFKDQTTLLTHIDNAILRCQQGGGPFSIKDLQSTRSRLVELIESTPKVVLLHGDLHHGNLIRMATGDYAAIDPKGMIGDPVIETASWLRNPEELAQGDGKRATARRVDILSSELAMDKQRIRSWGKVLLSIASILYFQDHGKVWATQGVFEENLDR